MKTLYGIQFEEGMQPPRNMLVAGSTPLPRLPPVNWPGVTKPSHAVGIPCMSPANLHLENMKQISQAR